MKKTISLIAILTIALSAMAQTNFRHISFAEAQKAAKAEKKLIFVDFYTSWCGPCKMMARDVFPQQKVGEFMNERFVCVKYDAEKEELDLVKKTNVTAYPTFVIFDADGKEVNRKEGGASAEAFIADIDRLSDTELTPEKITARYAKGERSPRLVKVYAAMLTEEMYNSRREREAKKAQRDSVVNGYYGTLSDKEKLSKENFFLYSEYCERTADQKMQFLYANRDKVKNADKAEAETILKKAYTRELSASIMFTEPFNADAYKTFRQQLTALDFIDKAETQPLLGVLDAYATGDIEKYVDAVAENAGEKYNKLSFSIFYGTSTALKNAAKETKQRAAQLIRKTLPVMSGNEIAFIGSTLMDLEK